MKPNQSLTRDVDLNTYDNKYKIILNYPTLEDQLIYLDDTVEWEQKIMLLVDKIYDDSGSEVDEKSYLDLIVNLNVDDKIAIREALEEVSTFAVDFNMKKGFTCENKSCKSYHKKQDYEIPMEVFFENIFKNFI